MKLEKAEQMPCNSFNPAYNNPEYLLIQHLSSPFCGGLQELY